MSSAFDLDDKGAAALAATARDNPLDPSKMPVPVWAGMGEQFKGFMGASASAARSLAMAGAPGAMAVDWAMEAGDSIGGRTARREAVGLDAKQYGATEWYFKNVVDGVGQDTVDFWTPRSEVTGAAAQTVGTVFSVAGALPQIIGMPFVFLNDAAMRPGIDVVQAGGSTGAALGASGVSLVGNAVGMALPAAFGKGLATRVATGAGGNLVVGAGINAGTQQILKSDGLDELAAGYDPLNPQNLLLDTLMGAAFGYRHHAVVSRVERVAAADNARARLKQEAARGIAQGRMDAAGLGAVGDAVASPAMTPSQRAAVLAAANAVNFVQGSLPGTPLTPDAMVQSQDAMAQAIRQVLAGQRAAVDGMVDMAQFQLRPELQPQPAPGLRTGNYGEFLVALESGGRADAKAGTSSATGLHQFTSGTWLRTVRAAAPEWAKGMDDAELLAQRTNPERSAEMELALRAENTAALQQAGIEPDALNLYAAHHFGSGGGVRFGKASGDTPMAKILTKAQMDANPYLRGMTKAEAIENWRGRAKRAGVVLSDDLDAPNFGLPDPPRTIADDDPFWQAIPEGQNGRETVNIDTPERQTLRDQLVEEHFAQAQQRILGDGDRPIAYVMGGGGASGKGTILRALKEAGAVPRSGAVHIDPDAIKAGEHGISGIPEYRAMVDRSDSRAAAVVHKESSLVAQRVRERAVEGKYDLILDRTLGDPAKGMKELQALKAAGYDVRLYGVTVDPGTAVQRAAKRAKGSGRFVPLDHLLKAHKGFASAFEDYAKLADEAFLYDNSGETHRLLAQGGSGSPLQVLAENGYTQFWARRSINEKASTHRSLQAAPAGPGRPAGERDAGAVAEGDRSPGARGARERSPERLEAGDRGAGAPQGEAGLDPQRFPVQGADSTVTTERGLTIPVRWALVEIGQLNTSHDDALHVNPEFPAELQPRDRSRAASEQQIARIANNVNPEFLAESPKAADGAPIVGQDMVVESGNARTIAVRRAYATGKADAYREYLVENAERFGLDPAAVDGVTRPMLVRVATGEYDRADFARQANESTVATMSATERAVSDARRLPDLGDLHANDDGTINMRASGKFVSGFIEAIGPNERAAMSTADGSLSQEGQARIRNAVFARAYGDADLVAMMAEATDANVKNVLAGMLRAAPAVARLREMIAEGGRYGPDFAPDLSAAARKFSQLRSEGMTVEQFEAQGDFFGGGGLSPKARELLQVIGENARAPKRMGEFLQRYVAAVDAMGDPKQADLMGGHADADAAIGAARSETARANDAPPAPRQGSGLFNAAGRATEAAKIQPEVDAAMRVLNDHPGLMVMGEDGTMRPVEEFLAEVGLDAAKAAENSRAVDSASNCMLRNAP